MAIYWLTLVYTRPSGHAWKRRTGIDLDAMIALAERERDRWYKAHIEDEHRHLVWASADTGSEIPAWKRPEWTAIPPETPIEDSRSR